jgi:prolyl-tRNA synthetase
MRGDLEVNEVKLANVIGASEVRMATNEDAARLLGASFGSLGPVGLKERCKSMFIVADYSAAAVPVSVVGALEDGYHLTNVVYGRDWKADLIADVRTVKAGDHCPICGGELYEKKGNELGHIFKLGRKYTQSRKFHYLAEDGKTQIPTMGCYGIGVDRTLASVIEERHDEKGIVWPISLAPYHVIIVPIKYDGPARETADRLMADLEAQGVEVLLDDRSERPGVKFNDADLLGIPYRVVIGEKNLKKDIPQLELKKRSEKEARLVDIDKAAAEIAGLVKQNLVALQES